MGAVVPAVLVAIAGGIAIAFQSQFSGVIGERLGVIESVFILHVGGILLATVLILAVRGGNLSAWRSLPWYAYIAGFLGVLIVAAISFAVPRLGLATTLTLSIVTQLLIGVVFDHFGLFGVPQPMTVSRGLGIAVLLVGTWLVLR